MTLALLAALPWLLPLLAFVAVVRLPRELPDAGSMDEPAGGDEASPRVSIIVPARNEAHNIERVLGSLAAQEHPSFEIVTVDDRSDDGTAELARRVAAGASVPIEVVDGAPLPDGWTGKPWACAQGVRRARGDLLLFTDADTVHAPALLARAVAGLREDDADALTVVGRQLVETFWERLVQPHVFAGMLVRYPDRRDPLPARRWRGAIANGQYLLFTREAYEAAGGHEAVAGEVVEDMRLAQILVKAGRTLSVRRAEDALATRMYRSLGELVAGWSKNLVLGGTATLPPGLLRTLAAPLALIVGVALWIVPPVLLGVALAGLGPPWMPTWAGVVTGAGALFWSAVTWRFGAPPRYGLLYPLGAAVVLAIVLRAWLRGSRVEWKGREYRQAGTATR